MKKQFLELPYNHILKIYSIEHFRFYYVMFTALFFLLCTKVNVLSEFINLS